MEKKENILKAISGRYSPKKFSEQEIETEKLNSIFEAARVAPSGFNNQPWRYVFIDKKSKNRDKLEKSLMPGNGWAKTAPGLIVCFTNKKFQKSANNIPYHIYDSALSVMSLVIEAENQGLKTHQMGGFFGTKVKEAVNIPEEYDVLVVIAIGYEDGNLNIVEKIRDKIINKIIKSRDRKKIEEIVYYDSYK